MSYPYINVTGSLRDFLKKIVDRAFSIPDKLTQEKLIALGFGTKSHRQIIPILKFINFLESDGKPTENMTKFRDKTISSQIMGKCIKNSYKELFELYPDAPNRSNSEISNFFSTKTTSGAQVIEYMTRTFKTLAEFSSFEVVREMDESKHTDKPEEPATKEMSHIEQMTQLPLTINIQIQLPVTENVEVYDKIFEALKRHLINRPQ